MPSSASTVYLDNTTYFMYLHRKMLPGDLTVFTKNDDT